MLSLETFAITPATTGGDMLSLLSEQETSCIKENVGDAAYQFLENAPLMMMTGGDISQAAPMFNCLEENNVIYLAVAFLDLQAGGWEPESRKCITEVGLSHPDSVYIRLGLQMGNGPANPDETMDYNIAIHECLSDGEKKEFTIGVWLAIDSASDATGADILDLLTEDEAACVADNLSVEQLAAIPAASALQAVTIGSGASHCVSHKTNVEIFVNGIGWSLGGTTDETLSCLREFAEANPDYVEIFTTGLDGINTMPASEFVEITEAGNAQYGCMTEEEVLRVQNTIASVLSKQ